MRQFWQNSRPASPAPAASPIAGTAFEHLKHLEVPGRGPQTGERGRPESIGGNMQGRSEDFAAGYSLGLIGGVRSWVSTYAQEATRLDVEWDGYVLTRKFHLQMMRGNKSLRDSQPPSRSGSEDDNEVTKSPTGAVAAAAEHGETTSRARKAKVGGTDAMDVGA